MKIYTKLEYVWDNGMGRYTLFDSVSYDYSGEVALACGATSGQKDVASSTQNFMTQAQQQSSAVFGSASQVFNGLMATFAPIVAAGPNQQGFSQQELSNLQSQAITQSGQGFRNAKQELGENLAASGGGNTALPSGVAANEETQLAEAGANQTATQLGQITEANYATGRQNYENAVQGELGATGVYSAASAAENAASESGNTASTAANDVANAQNGWVNAAFGALGAVGGAAVTAYCPAYGTLYLMADGTEKAVQFLTVGDLLMGIDSEPQVIEEIQSTNAHIIKVTTEDGHMSRSSKVHAFALPHGGFTVAAHSLGKTIVTEDGASKVVSVEDDNVDVVYNVITDGSHTYRADGIWALGVGEAERVKE